jgi:glycolate oxidase
VVADPDRLVEYQLDQTPLFKPQIPAAVVFPQSTADVQAVIETARRTQTPVVARGAGSGLAGGANAIEGCIIICLSRMNKILEISERDLYAVVQPGVLNGELSERVAARGLFYPPDPASASFSSIGGNIATNAGGLSCIKYGVTRDYVLGLEVVLADGRVLRTGRRTVKGVAGLDLTSLFVGSEGTLGIVTEAVLRLRPAAAVPITAVGFFSDLTQIGDVVSVLVAQGLVPSMLELMDRTTVRAVESHRRMDLDTSAAALLIAQSDAGGETAEREITAIAECFRASGATFAHAFDDPADAEQLLAARRLAYPALEALGHTLLDDVAVPRSQIGAFVAGVEDIATHHALTIAVFGHAGDGNMHPTVVYGLEEAEAATAAFEDIVRLALDLGGTITGEHGVGILKSKALSWELDPVAADLHQVLKRAIDPDGLFNPGKGLPEASRSRPGSYQ